MKANSLPFCPSCGFALISVLALVSLAALTATAFLASARLERQATRPIGETVRLQMTLNAARECATQTLNDVAGKRWNFVTTYWRTNIADEIGYPFSGYAKSPDTISWTYIAGFTPATWTDLSTNVIGTNVSFSNLSCQGSFLTDISNFMANATNGFTANPSPTSKICTTISLLGGQTSPPVGWVYIKQDIRTNPTSTNTASLPAARFAYFIQDLAGLIDAERMGATNSRPTGTNAEEISLINLVGTSATNLNLESYTNKRPQYLTPGMLLSANGGILTYTNDLRYFASRLRYCHWTTNSDNWDRIPFLPISSTSPFYPKNCASLKRNLNTNLDATNGFTNIVATITNNLPGFTNRAGGMAGGTYVSNIAANIVDLFDTDNFATTVGNSVRGIDSYPFVNEIWDRVELKNINVNTSDSTKWVVKYDLEITTWMELWNMSSQPVTNGSMRIFYRNREILTNRTSGPTDIPSSFTNSLNYTTNVTLNFTTNFSPTNPTLSDLTNSGISPNSYHMVSFPTFTNNVSINLTNIPVGTASTQTNLHLLWATNGNLNGYATYFSSNSAALPAFMSTHPSRVDSSSSLFNGIQRNTNKPVKHFLDSSQTVWWRGNATPNSNLKLGLTGDPRIMFHLSPTAGQTWWDHQFEAERASWWARNTMGSGASDYTVDLNLWPEYSHNSSNYPNTTDPSKDPLSITIPSQEANKPVQIIYNASPTNIVQLGQTFDPMQWSYNVNNNTNGLPLTGATAANSSGGGHTLRIGRAEHPRFAFTNLGGTYPVPSLGTSAAGLLDIFCTTNTYNWAGRINLNSAPPAVLAALAGGINLTRDPNKTGTEVNATMINAFTNGVMRFRQTYPFITPSQLAFISRNYGTNPADPSTCWTNTFSNNAVFSTSVDGGLNGVSGINDQGFEEWFSKIYHLTCVQSYNYRIYVVAQLTDTNGNPKGAMMKKYYQVHLRNNSMNGSGDTAAQSISPVVTYEALY